MNRQGRDARLATAAGRQAGAFSFQQALEFGFPRATIQRRLDAGTWQRARPGVFVVAGSEQSRVRDLWVAVLAVGPTAILSHESAALLHGAERLPERPITLTVPHGGHHHVGGAFVHQINDHRPSHRTSWRGLPASTPARAVVELGATQSIATIGRVADDFVQLRKTTMAEIAAVLAHVARPGKPGLDRLIRVMEVRGDGYVPPASELERALFAALDAGGLPPPERQIRLPGRGLMAGVADAGYRDAQIIIEADGRRWHARMEACRKDRERDAQVIRAGWVPLRFVYEQIVHHPDEVCAIVAETRAVRLALLRRSA